MKFRNLKYSIVIFLSTITSCTSQKSNTLDLSTGILGKPIDSIVRPNFIINNGYGIDNGAVKKRKKIYEF